MAAATPTIVVHDARTLASASQPRFNMVAMHWRGNAPVRYRVRFADGWSPWHVADADTVGVHHGWNDIGYNFLVDKYGQVFEGRYGGVDRNVIGAHTLGFNTGTVGVALIGDYTSTKITDAAAKSLEALLAWRLDLAHVDPLSLVS